MSWKDYFYFTQSQRRALNVLLFVFVVMFALSTLYNRVQTRNCKNEGRDSIFTDQVLQFKSSLRETKPYYSYRDKYDYTYGLNYQKKQEIKLFFFNPNTLDSIGFIKLGIKSFIVKNIIKYRRKGGKFKNSEAFSKVYGLSGEQFALLEQYIKIPAEEKIKSAQIDDEPIVKIELNSTDTLELKKLRGIGSGLAKQIINYRKSLGGYVSLKQLNEIRGISPELANELLLRIYINTNAINKIPLNKSSIDRLRAHPYIDFYQAKAIYEYRRNEGKIKSLDEAKRIDDESLTPEFWERVGVYLEF